MKANLGILGEGKKGRSCRVNSEMGLGFL